MWQWIALFLGLVAIPFFILIFLLGPSPSCKNTIVSSAYHFLSTTLPTSSWKLLKRILGPKCVNLLLRVFHWIGFERNPLVQIFFLALVTSGVYVFFIFGWPRIPTELVPHYHRIPIIFSIIQVYCSFILTSASDPGKIALENPENYLGYYPMDNLLFSPIICRTCRIIKPARSKHCSMCGGCIMRLDHHCVWVNNCVGHKNIHYFVYFLISVIWICAYGLYLCFLLSAPSLRFSLYFQQGFGAFMTWAFLSEPALISLGIFIGVASILVLFFLVHFLYLNVWSGMTTNESFKWDDLEWMLKNKHLYLGEKDNKLCLSRNPLENPKSFKDLVNIYDQGILENLKQIIWPSSLPKSYVQIINPKQQEKPTLKMKHGSHYLVEEASPLKRKRKRKQTNKVQ